MVIAWALPMTAENWANFARVLLPFAGVATLLVGSIYWAVLGPKTAGLKRGTAQRRGLPGGVKVLYGPSLDKLQTVETALRPRAEAGDCDAQLLWDEIT